MRKYCVLGLAVSALMCAHAGLIVSSGPAVTSLGGPEITAQQQSTPFQLLQTSTITSFDFTSIDLGSGFAGYAGSISWFIYADRNGAPGNVLANVAAVGAQRTLLGTDSYAGIPANIYLNTLSVPALTLAPGSYWLGLKNGPASLSGFNGFLWAQVGAPGAAAQAQTQSSLGTSGLKLNFDVYGSSFAPIPEPATFWLLTAAVATLGLARRRSS